MLSDADWFELLLEAFPEFAGPGGREQYLVLDDNDPYLPKGCVLIYCVLGDLRGWLERNLLAIRNDHEDERGRLIYNSLLAKTKGKIELADTLMHRAQNIYKGKPRRSAEVRTGAESRVRRFFELMELAAVDAQGDRSNLLAIELFEGVSWTDDLIEYLGPNVLAIYERSAEGRDWRTRVHGDR